MTDKVQQNGRFIVVSQEGGIIDLYAEVPQCDFCSSSVVIGHLVVPPGLVAFPPLGSIPVVDCGKWAACQTCYELISKGDWPLLVERVLSKFQGQFELSPEVIKAQVNSMYDVLRLNWRGEFKPLRKD